MRVVVGPRQQSAQLPTIRSRMCALVPLVQPLSSRLQKACHLPAAAEVSGAPEFRNSETLSLDALVGVVH